MTTLRASGGLEFAPGVRKREVAASTVGEAIDSIGGAFRERVVENGAIKRFVVVFVNGEAAALDTRLAADDEVTIVPAVSGG
ncbi:MAG: MoaD/ThiS family protein [Thermoplasmatota archaeon]